MNVVGRWSLVAVGMVCQASRVFHMTQTFCALSSSIHPDPLVTGEILVLVFGLAARLR